MLRWKAVSGDFRILVGIPESWNSGILDFPGNRFPGNSTKTESELTLAPESFAKLIFHGFVNNLKCLFQQWIWNLGHLTGVCWKYVKFCQPHLPGLNHTGTKKWYHRLLSQFPGIPREFLFCFRQKSHQPQSWLIVFIGTAFCTDYMSTSTGRSTS